MAGSVTMIFCVCGDSPRKLSDARRGDLGETRRKVVQISFVIVTSRTRAQQLWFVQRCRQEEATTTHSFHYSYPRELWIEIR
eukprot:scaffold9272_cov195-Amphora_coffeaeformis.AAC.9